MTKKRGVSRRPTTRRDNAASLRELIRRLQTDVSNCMSEVERLARENAINVTRIGEMQSEIDQIRAASRGTRA